MKKWIKVLSGLLAVLLVACIGLVAWMYSIYKGISDDPFSAFKKPSTGSTITVKDSQNIEHTQTQGVVNILLLGIDSNAAREAAHKGYRSDTMILCSFDFTNNRLNMISVPRDTRTKVNKLDYVRTARSKGCSESRIILKHVLRNGLLPVVTGIGGHIATIVGGAIVTESVFAIPGVASLMINAVKIRDVPVVMGIIVVISVFVGVVNLLVDLTYAVIDPRVKLNG